MLSRSLAPATLLLILVATVGVAACAADDHGEATDQDAVEATEAVMLRTATCDCCGEHAAYLEEAGYEVAEQIVDDPNAEAGVPMELGSCHVTMIDGYRVVGHVPTDVIAELREQAPNVDGVSLPGMPQGSPGMPGNKNEPWEFITFTNGTPDGVFATR